MYFLFRTLENKLIEKKNPIYCEKSGKVSGMYGGKFIARCQKLEESQEETYLPGKRVHLHVWDGRRSYSHRQPTTLLFQCVHSHFFNESKCAFVWTFWSPKRTQIKKLTRKYDWLSPKHNFFKKVTFWAQVKYMSKTRWIYGPLRSINQNALLAFWHYYRWTLHLRKCP